jgi:hypothetical protein
VQQQQQETLLHAHDGTEGGHKGIMRGPTGARQLLLFGDVWLDLVLGTRTDQHNLPVHDVRRLAGSGFRYEHGST